MPDRNDICMILGKEATSIYSNQRLSIWARWDPVQSYKQQSWLIYNVQCILDCFPVSVSTEPLYSDDQFAHSYSNPYKLYTCQCLHMYKNLTPPNFFEPQLCSGNNKVSDKVAFCNIWIYSINVWISCHEIAYPCSAWIVSVNCSKRATVDSVFTHWRNLLHNVVKRWHIIVSCYVRWSHRICCNIVRKQRCNEMIHNIDRVVLLYKFMFVVMLDLYFLQSAHPGSLW